MKSIKELFQEIEKRHNENSILTLYDEVVTIIRDVLKVEGIERANNTEIIKLFESELISTGKVPARFLRDITEIVEAKNKYDHHTLNKNDIEKARKGKNHNSNKRFCARG